MWYNTLMLITTKTGLLLLLNSDTGDFNVTDLPLEISIGSAQACFQFEAVDDEIVESDEIVSLIIDTLNPYDIVVDGNSTIIISDNDGRYRQGSQYP